MIMIFQEAKLIKQSLIERVEAVKNTGLADEIIVEEHVGQKIDDIRRFNVDIFTVGSDWTGKFDYLNDYCKVVYLERTEGVSSSMIRNESKLKLGVAGDTDYTLKFINESKYVNGVELFAVYTENERLKESISSEIVLCKSYNELIEKVDSVFLISSPKRHYEQIKYALSNNTHVLCESPIVLKSKDYDELKALAKKNNLILNEAIRTAYSTAYERMRLLIKSGIIGKVVSIDSTCTSLREYYSSDSSEKWNSICTWGPVGMLPVFDVLGIDYNSKQIISLVTDKDTKHDVFTRINFNYANACASVKIANGVKSESELIISGTKGYVFVPAPWWKLDYFEVRFEDASKNKRFFYQLDGEGIRYELVSFVNMIQGYNNHTKINDEVSSSIISVIEDYYNDIDSIIIK